LRHHFGDPLLEQIGRNLELAARGRALTDPVKTILSQVSELNDQSTSFDASSARRVFRISATTYTCEVLATLLISRLQEIAPRISVQFEELSADTADRVVDGQIDFAITISARLLDKCRPMTSLCGRKSCLPTSSSSRSPKIIRTPQTSLLSTSCVEWDILKPGLAG
jgi:DNA-binding transcriptional LysR family regulator